MSALKVDSAPSLVAVSGEDLVGTSDAVIAERAVISEALSSNTGKIDDKIIIDYAKWDDNSHKQELSETAKNYLSDVVTSAKTETLDNDRASNFSVFQSDSINSSAEISEKHSTNRDREWEQVFFSSGKPRLSRRKNTVNTEHKSSLNDLNNDNLGLDSNKSNATYDLNAEEQKKLVNANKFLSDNQEDNHNHIWTYYDKKNRFQPTQSIQPKRHRKTAAAKKSLTLQPKPESTTGASSRRPSLLSRELSDFKADYRSLRRIRRQGTSASLKPVSSKSSSTRTKSSRSNYIKKPSVPELVDANDYLSVDKSALKKRNKTYPKVFRHTDSVFYQQRDRNNNYLTSSARSRSLPKHIDGILIQRQIVHEEIHYGSDSDVSIHRHRSLAPDTRPQGSSKVIRSNRRSTVRFEKPNTSFQIESGNSSYSSPSATGYARMANPKFSASLYGPGYNNRLQLSEDRSNVNREYATEDGGLRISAGSKPAKSGPRSNTNHNGTTTVTTINYNNSHPYGYGSEVDNSQTVYTTTTHARKSMDPKFAPSLYGPGYNNRERTVDNGYEITGDRSVVNESVQRQSNRSTSEPRTLTSRSGTSTTITPRYNQSPSSTTRTNDNFDSNDTMRVRKSLDPKSAPDLYGPYYKNRGNVTEGSYSTSGETVPQVRSSRKAKRSVTRQNTMTTINDDSAKTITYYNGHASAATNNGRSLNGNTIERQRNTLDPKFHPSLYGPYYRNKDAYASNGQRIEMSESAEGRHASHPTATISVSSSTSPTYYTPAEDGKHHDAAAGTIKRLLSAKNGNPQREISPRLYGPAYGLLLERNTEDGSSPPRSHREESHTHRGATTARRDINHSTLSSRPQSSVHRTVYNPDPLIGSGIKYSSTPRQKPNVEGRYSTLTGNSRNTRLPSITTSTNKQALLGSGNAGSTDRSSEGNFRYKRTLNSNSHAPAQSEDLASTPEIQPARLKRRVPANVHDDDNLLFGETEEEIRDAARRRHLASHDAWPMFKYDRADGIACLVRTAPGKIDEVRNRLRLMDGVSDETQARIPPLPASEFDADEQVELSPMQLVWAASPPPDVRPLYILVPVGEVPFNETLQQLLFMYTVDYGDWQFAEGRFIQVPVDGVPQDFCEVVVPEAFRNIIFDAKMKYFENVRELGAAGGELYSTMEPGVRVAVSKRTFDENAQIKIRVEPLDLNETELHKLFPGTDTQHALAVSPVVKITASQITKRPIVVSMPKPGQSLFGSTAMGLKTKANDVRDQKVALYTKDQQLSKYQQDGSLHRENAGEYDFNARIWKAGGSVYAFLVMTGQDGVPQVDPEDPKDFLSRRLFEQTAGELDKEEMKIRALGRQLVNNNVTSDIFQGNEGGDLNGAVLQILRNWKNANNSSDESSMVRQLVGALRDTGFPVDASTCQMRYRRYVRDREETKMLAIFNELQSSPAVMVNWYALGRELGLSDAHLRRIKDQTPDLRKRCYTVLRAAYERLKNEEEYNREILLKYIAALRKMGCPRIASNVEQNQLPKFYVPSQDL